jgi:hypothetical protein
VSEAIVDIDVELCGEETLAKLIKVARPHEHHHLGQMLDCESDAALWHLAGRRE